MISGERRAPLLLEEEREGPIAKRWEGEEEIAAKRRNETL